MDTTEYKERHLALLKKHEVELELEVAKLNREYAFSNNTVVVGDIVEDHLGKVRVVTIKHTPFGYTKPYCVYEGDVLLKNGTKSKRGRTRVVHQINLLTK